MGKKRQMSHAELFQLIYEDTPPSSWESVTPHSRCGLDIRISKVCSVEMWGQSKAGRAWLYSEETWLGDWGQQEVINPLLFWITYSNNL